VRRHIIIRIDGVRAVLLAIALVVATGLVACGGDEGEPGAPLTLEQRLLRESDVPGSKVDPVEVRLTADKLDEFTDWPEYVRAHEIDRSKLEDAGFVSAIHETRFIPNRPGGPHTGDAPHVRILVLQFESDDGAVMGVDLVHEQGLKRCPGNCAMQIEEFDVSGVPDAEGARAFTTKEALEATGGQGFPSDAYAIVFADGPFVYEVDGFADPGEISKKQIEEIAQKVHDRVEGAPPAET
jgi:hypothetical protein